MPDNTKIDFPKIQKEIYDNATRQGFHGKNEPSEIEYRCLIIEEILEAYRAFDECTPPVYFNVASGEIDPVIDPKEYLKFLIDKDQRPKPEGYAVELVDVTMRCLDYTEEKGYTHYLVGRNIEKKPDKFFRSLIEIACDNNGENAICHSWTHIIIDKILRFFDVQEWDFLSILELKMRYNQTRPYRHGMKGVE